MDKPIPEDVVFKAADALCGKWNLHYPDAVRMATVVLGAARPRPGHSVFCSSQMTLPASEERFPCDCGGPVVMRYPQPSATGNVAPTAAEASAPAEHPRGYTLDDALHAVRIATGIEYDRATGGWWLPGEPSPRRFPTLPDALRAALATNHQEPTT